ncbi:putative membrane protein [Rubidibacter lacunae KORDI 51-2]|uniref:Putative membrane protein n=1 Tax=Rubidibacter lacunae KORDI 51-2 TaxID=582515 RepID=U5DIA4_9CHRO|nr:RDD family protein [Rubidibacter lacunae]ERN41401.1 putative membrane protein [Rubidibacter lacunae KORDI 51-2]
MTAEANSSPPPVPSRTAPPPVPPPEVAPPAASNGAFIEPLSIGDTASAAVRLYRRQFRTLFLMAVAAHLWLFVPVYGWAKFFVWSGAIARLVYNTAAGRPETWKTALRRVQSRKWGLLVVGTVVTATTIGLSFAALLALLGGVGVLTLFVGGMMGSLDGVIIGTAGSLLVLMTLTLVMGWISSRLVLVDIPLAVATQTNWRQSLARGWQVTGNAVWRVQAVVAVVALVLQPISFALLTLQSVLPLVSDAMLPGAEIESNSIFEMSWFVLGGSLLLPLVQGMRALLYYDLTRRRDGFDLNLDASAIAATSDSAPSPLLAPIELATPESIDLEFELAGIGRRACALAIDYLLWLLLLTFLILGWALASERITELLSHFVDDEFRLYPWLIAIQLLLGFAFYVGYFVSFETLDRGQTPGKRILGIRVIRDDGRPVRLPQAALRSLLRPLDDVLLSGLVGELFIVLTEREKRIGDWLAGTLVIRQERPSSDRRRIQLAPESQAIASHLVETAAIARLGPQDFAIIRTYLQRRKTLDPHARVARCRALAKQLCDRLGLDDLPENVSPQMFLEGVYRACQQQLPLRLQLQCRL